MTTAGYSIETNTSASRGMSLADAARWFARCRAMGWFAMVSRGDGTTLTGCHGFYWPPYATAPEMTPEERAALTDA